MRRSALMLILGVLLGAWAATGGAGLALANPGMGGPGGMRPGEGTGGRPHVTVPPPVPLPVPPPALTNRLELPPQPPPTNPDYASLENAIRAGADTSGNTVWSRVFGRCLSGQGMQSCVEASQDRARTVAAEINNQIDSGRLDMAGHTVTVGTRSGYQTAGASWHTYTVIEVKDPSGRSVRTIEVDNYVFGAVDVDTPDSPGITGPPTPVDWNDPAQQADPMITIPPKK